MNTDGQAIIFKMKEILVFKERRWILPKYCLFMMTLLDLAVTGTTAQCTMQNTQVVTFNETDMSTGLELLQLPGSGVTWAFHSDTAPIDIQDFLELHDKGTTWVLRLKKAINLDDPATMTKLGGATTYILHVSCTDQTNPAGRKHQIIFTVSAVNEFAPVFNSASIQIWTKENATPPEVLLYPSKWVTDADYNQNVEIPKFALERADVEEKINGMKSLELVKSSLGNWSVRTNSTLDFESLPADQKYLVVQLIAYDAGGLSGSTTLTVHVEDQDDLGPVFYYPGCSSPCDVQYTVDVNDTYTGPVTEGLKPAPIQAQDGDTLNATVTFAFTDGPPDYQEYFSLDEENGTLSVLKELYKYYNGNTLSFTFEATENTDLKRSTATTLQITVSTDDPIFKADGDSIILIVAIILTILVVILAAGLVLAWMKWKDHTRVYP